MCTYCELKQDVLNTWINELPVIGSFREGHTLFECKLNRYVDYDENDHIGELILEEAVDLSDGTYTVQQKIVPIKYCPFCGEKL